MLEMKLRAGMTKNGLVLKAQEQIIQQINSFALYGFPESHAASFALIAYASAYLKYHYLAAFTCAMLNNQPMGFYSPATLVKDAQRHGLKTRAIDVQKSDWACTLEPISEEHSERADPFAMRLGLSYAKGLRKQAGEAIVYARQLGPYVSVYDLAQRVPELRKSELVLLAQIGALNSLGEELHRRDALWQAERAGRRSGKLLDATPDTCEAKTGSPLFRMNVEERIVADFKGTGLTVGPHPVAYHRERLKNIGVTRAADLSSLQAERTTRIAGCVIARQRPGTAKGFVFLSIEDESGIANAIVHPELYERYRALVTYGKFLLIEGKLQNQDDVISIKASYVEPLYISAADVRSHDFH